LVDVEKKKEEWELGKEEEEDGFGAGAAPHCCGVWGEWEKGVVVGWGKMGGAMVRLGAHHRGRAPIPLQTSLGGKKECNG